MAGDPVAYEAWFARQPKPPTCPVEFMTEEDVAAVRWVTRHNPPWARGPVPGLLPPAGAGAPVRARGRGRGGHTAAQARLAAGARDAGTGGRPATPLADLRARVRRLLDRTQPRLLEELDLAEAICAAKWPKWPAYRGPVDPFLLRRALAGAIVDTPTLHWLGSTELAQACKEGEA